MAVSLSWKGRQQAEQTYLQACDTAQKIQASGKAKALNRLLCMDNLKGLSQLLSEGARADLIYIDPPYNTGQDLAYSDKHPSSDDWLSFLYPRLCLGRDLLKDQGLMFVSIDEREAAPLGVLLQEIFSKPNHIMTIKWKRKRKPSFLRKHASPVFESIYVFAKNARSLPKLRGEMTSETSRPVLNHGNSIVGRTIRAGRPARCPDGVYEPGSRKVRTLSFEQLDPLVVAHGVVAQDCQIKGPFRVSQDILDSSVFITKQLGLRREIHESEQRFRHATDDGSTWPTNEDADREILEIYGSRIFPFAKPVQMLQKLVAMLPAPDDGTSLHCVDFFAGTGAFGEAVHRQSLFDGVPRHFTLIQSAEELSLGRSPVRQTIFDLAVERMETLSRQSPTFSFFLEDGEGRASSWKADAGQALQQTSLEHTLG